MLPCLHGWLFWCKILWDKKYRLKSSLWFWIWSPLGKITEVATKMPKCGQTLLQPRSPLECWIGWCRTFLLTNQPQKVVDYGILFAWLICQVDVFCLPCGWNFLLRHLMSVITSNYVSSSVISRHTLDWVHLYTQVHGPGCIKLETFVIC